MTQLYNCYDFNANHFNLDFLPLLEDPDNKGFLVLHFLDY